ncbi:MAG: hypothetical protein GY953_31085, partial [bacterium]|nr:hypothetical protein [bacterium]
MHVSEAKREANRRNARKSTGPRTRAGKARSCRNAIRTGLLAKTSTLLQTEDEAFQHQLEGFWEHFRPAGPDEETLVAEFAASSWRLDRASAVET